MSTGTLWIFSICSNGLKEYSFAVGNLTDDRPGFHYRAETAAISVVKFYGVDGNLSCVKTDTIPAMGVLDYWLPDLTCSP